jgi:phospholipid/cholesterol/gamma-HCH transport system substrate-binding protein
MDLEFKRKEKVVGFFILSISLLLILSLAFIGRGKGWFKDYVEYYSVFEETYNLQNGAPVKLYNANIGKVKDIKLVEDEVRVKLLIVSDYASRIRSSSYVTVQSPTFIGSEYVALVTGDKDAKTIIEGEEIPSVEKKSISDILAEFQVEETAKKFVSAVQELSDMATKLNDPKGPVFSILGDIETVISDIEKGDGNIGELLRTSTLTDEIKDRLSQVETILKDVKDAVSKTPYTVDLVNSNLEKIEQIGSHIEDGSGDVIELIKELKKRIKDIDGIISNFEKGSRNVPEITKVTLDGLHEIRIGVKKADDALEALQKNFLIRNNLPKRNGPEQYKPDVRE